MIETIVPILMLVGIVVLSVWMVKRRRKSEHDAPPTFISGSRVQPKEEKDPGLETKTFSVDVVDIQQHIEPEPKEVGKEHAPGQQKEPGEPAEGKALGHEKQAERGHVPPGQAKKEEEKIPPGQAKKD